MPTCKKFCEDVFVPEKERVEQLFSKKHKLKVNKSFDLKTCIEFGSFPKRLSTFCHFNLAKTILEHKQLKMNTI